MGQIANQMAAKLLTNMIKKIKENREGKKKAADKKHEQK